MKSNRWWIQGLPLHRLRKYLHNGRVGQDGAYFSLEEWGAQLDEARALRPGDKLWNTYNGSWTEIAEVKFEWGPIQHSKVNFDTPEITVRYGRVVGRFICGYRIVSIDGYFHYDTPSLAKRWCKTYPENE